MTTQASKAGTSYKKDPSRQFVGVDINKKLWSTFSRYIDKKYGKGYKTKMVERLIKKYMARQAKKQGGKIKIKDVKKKQWPAATTVGGIRGTIVEEGGGQTFREKVESAE